MTGRWDFWIDRGGTFTDVVAPAGRPPGRPRAALGGPGPVSGRGAGRHPRAARWAGGPAIPGAQIGSVRLGTTVATNALLERTGEPTVLVITRGFRDALRIGYPEPAAHLSPGEIILPELLYSRVDRGDPSGSGARGEVIVPLDEGGGRGGTCGPPTPPGCGPWPWSACTATATPAHEGQDRPDRPGHRLRAGLGVARDQPADEAGVPRGHHGGGRLPVPDPGPLRQPRGRHWAGPGCSGSCSPDRRLADAHRFRGKDSILSGPAGGIVGMARTTRGRLRRRDRLRHGRHLDRCVALRRGVRAAVRDRGGRGPDARPHAEHPHRRGRRRLGPALRRQPVPGRPGLGGGRPGARVLPPRRPAHRDRRQRGPRPHPAGPGSPGCSAPVATSRWTRISR